MVNCNGNFCLTLSNRQILIAACTKAALTFCYIQIEKVAIEDCLHHSSHNGDHVKESLKVETPYPVEEVEGSVESQEEQIVGGDGLSFTRFADHE